VRRGATSIRRERGLPPAGVVLYALLANGLLAMLIFALAFASLTPEVTISGIVVASSGRHAAILVEGGRMRAAQAGDRAFGCDLAAIRVDGVEIVCAGERRTLRLVTSATPGGGSGSALAAAVEDAPADLTLSRADLEARLDREMSRLMTETTLVPVTSRGQIAGFTLSRVPAGTILETLGLKAGDVLVSVNDTPIDSFTTLVGLWPRLQTSGSVRAQIMREGRPLDISVSIK
jgi:type II secretion system protein C